MTAPVFVDTNVLVYARDSSDPVKHRHARAWLELLWKHGLGRLSRQVLNEYYVTVTRKLDPGLSRTEARDEVALLSHWLHEPGVPALLETAWAVEDRYGFSWWDALIVAAAQLGGCGTLLTEDLQDGLDAGGVRIVDPCRHEPAEYLGA